MKKIFIIAAVLFFGCVRPTYALIDTAVKTISGNITAAYDKAYQEFMKVQVVQQTQTMLKNYNESKVFYERMKAIQEHKGGIVGYVKDDIDRTIKQQNQETYWKIDRDFVNVNGYDSFVGQTVRSTDRQIQSKLDYSKEIHELDLRRDKNIQKEIVDQAVKKDLKPEEREKLNMKINLTSMEIMNSMNKTVQQILIQMNEQQAREWQQERAWDIEQAKMKAWIEKVQKETGRRKSADPYRALEEQPK